MPYGEKNEFTGSRKTPAGQHSPKGPLERGRVRLMLIDELAGKTSTNVALGKKYGVSTTAITNFGKRHAAEIAEVREKAAEEFRGLWIAEKRNRLAEYQQDAEDVETALAAGINTDPSTLYGAKHRALRNTAEELGQLPNKPGAIDVSAKVTYEVSGVDLNDLK
jgi:Cu/Zn superoxide dismutase